MYKQPLRMLSAIAKHQSTKDENMPIEPVILKGHMVRLEPLSLEHASLLWNAADPSVFQYATLFPENWTEEAFYAYIDQRLNKRDWYSFVMVLQETGQAVGITAYLDVRPAHRGLEIGATWIAKPYQGTYVNPESKYLLLCHAFEALRMIRVQLKCDARNLQSQRALEKLGAQREGILRKHVILPDDYVRDTVMFSIIDTEWPAIKAKLEARLGYV
jgi:RimJ/RimL family protein N-acetyltransferase